MKDMLSQGNSPRISLKPARSIDKPEFQIIRLHVRIDTDRESSDLLIDVEVLFGAIDQVLTGLH